MSHEQSETVEGPNGGWINIYGKATPNAGKQLPGTPIYKSVGEAVSAAQARSEAYGQSHTDSSFDMSDPMGYFHNLLYKLNTGNLFDLKTRVMLGLTNPDTLEEGHLGPQSGASGSWKPDINTQQIRPPTPGIVPATPLGAVR